MKGTERIINNYLNGKTDFSGIYLLGNKATILRELKKYVEKHPKSADKIGYMIENLNELLKSKLKHDNFMKVLSFEAKYEDNTFGCLDFACELLSCPRDEAIEICRKRHILDNEFKIVMKRFTNKFPNQVKEISYLESVYNEYKERYNKCDKKPKNQLYFEYFHDADKRVKTLIDVYNSEYCIEEYCSNTGALVYATRREIEGMTVADKAKYETQYNEVLQRDNSEFYKYIKFVISKLNEIKRDEFTMMDYHTYTRLNMNDFISLAKTLVEDESTIKDLILTIKLANKRTFNTSKSNELSCKTIIGGREITLEEKEMIFDYLEENNYPKCDYKIALRKYLDGEILNDKQLIKK